MSYSLDTIRLLMAHDSQDTAEQLINFLRNAGRATRAQLVLSEDDLISALKSGTWEIFLCRPQFGNCDYTQALNHLQRLGKSPLTLVLDDDLNADKLAAALEAGAQGVVPQDNRDLLLNLISQQLHTIQLRRELQQTEIELHDAEKRLSVLMDQSRDAIAYVVDGMHIHANDAYLELFGYESVDDLAGIPIMDMVSSDNHDSLKKVLRSRAQDSSKTHDLDCRGRSQQGEEFNATFTFSPSTFDGEDCTQIVIRTESGVDEETLRQIAQTDSTTGLPNRGAFLERLDQALAKTVNDGQTSAIYYLRIDAFEQYQSELGISGADAMLKAVAAALQQHAKDAMLARVSEEEFALLEPLADQDEAHARAESLRALIEKLMPEVQSRTLKITASIGVSFTREDSRNSQAVLTKALECCNRARAESNGQKGNAVVVHNPIDDLKAGSDEAIALTIKQALDKNSLELQYQNIMSLGDDASFFFEVFVNLPQEDGSVLDPAKFMPVAGKQGLASKVDRWVALNAMKEATATKADIKLLINISGPSLQDKGLGDWMVKAARATKIKPQNLVFQINEGDADLYLKQVAAFAQTVNDAGCLFSISRFGGALDPAKLLKHVPVQMVKCEGSFTRELGNEEQRNKLADLVTQANDHEIKVLIGFVESAEQMQQLWTLGGVSYLQGYYLAPPEPKMVLEND